MVILLILIVTQERSVVLKNAEGKKNKITNVSVEV